VHFDGLAQGNASLPQVSLQPQRGGQ